jgi:hypothetical protein
MTSSPENFTSLLNDVTERLFDPLPDATWVYPATATTPSWEPSGRTSASGANAAGDLRRTRRRCRRTSADAGGDLVRAYRERTPGSAASFEAARRVLPGGETGRSPATRRTR